MKGRHLAHRTDELGGRNRNCPALCAIETHGSPPRRGEAAARGGTAQSVGHPPLARRRVGGLVARKPIARRRRWEAVHLRQRRPRSPLAQRNRDHRKKEHQHDQHIGQRRVRADRIREAHRRPVSATTAAELATAGLERRRPRIRARLIWPSMAELHACFHLSQRRQAARDDAVFNELIAPLDEQDDDSDA